MNFESKPVKESIKVAAVRFCNEIFTGKIHGRAIVALLEKYPDWKSYEELEDGFVTSTGRFVGREEAAKIARAANQLDQYPDSPDTSLDSQQIEELKLKLKFKTE